jgi:hypothetical protein
MVPVTSRKTDEKPVLSKRLGIALIRRKRTSSATGFWTGFQASIRLIFPRKRLWFLRAR